MWKFSRLFIPCLGPLLAFTSFSQQSLPDSLSELLANANHDTVRLRILFQISGALRDRDPEKAIVFANKGMDLARQLNDQKAIAESYKCIGNTWLVRGEFSKSIEQYRLALAIQENMEDTEGMASSLNNLGLAYRMQGNLDSALEIHFRCLTLDEARKDKGGIAYSLGNIAAVYRTKGDFVKCLDFQIRCMKMLEELQDENALGICLANIASVHKELGNLPASMEYDEKALEKFEKTGNKIAIGHLLNNISNLLDKMNEYEKALGYMQRAIKIREELKDNHGLATSYINLATLYTKMKMDKEALGYYHQAIEMMEESGDNNGLGIALAQAGNAYLGSGMPAKSEIYLLKAIDVLKVVGNKAQMKDTYRALAVCNEQLKNYKEAYRYQQLYANIKDTIYNEENSRQTTEMSAKYESEKKEKEIVLQKAEISTKEAENKKQELFLMLIAAIAVAAGVIAVVIFRSLGVARRQKRVIEKQKHLVDEKNRHIEEKQKEIIDSITYAKRLQQAILPPVEMVRKHLPESFVLYKPKDIVAGDFYWFEVGPPPPSGSRGATLFLAAADCTGHGVPGAMVSVVCSNALNRAVKELGLHDTGKILDSVTDMVLETFEKSASEVKDGMDISLLKLEFSPSLSRGEGTEGPVPEVGRIRSVQWSGANNPLWYFQNGKLIEIKADKQPVGKYDNRKPFTTHTIELTSSPNGGIQEGAIFFLFTDGYPDQFGGPKGKKFKYSQFEKLLLANHHLPMDEQKDILDITIDGWRGKLEQVDDICVIGIKV